MRFFVSVAVVTAVAAAALGLTGVAVAMTPPVDSAPPAAPAPPPVLFIPQPVQPAQPLQPAQPPSGSTGSSAPSGCRDINIITSQKSFLFHSNIYRFHQVKHWCWRRGVVYDERHAWTFEGGSTACFDTVYPDNHWTFSWNGVPAGGDFSEERAHVTNCVFHIGDWKEYYPDVKIWAYADGTYKVETSN